MAAAEFYNDKVVRQFAVMTVVWGIVGMAVGVLIAAQLYWPTSSAASLAQLRAAAPAAHQRGDLRLRRLGAVRDQLHVVQRTCHVRLFSDKLAAFIFWGWQAVIVAAAITLPLGITQCKEYAELEWPIDLLITVVWVAYGVVFFGTIVKRRVQHIYVANWFFGAYIITIALLHIVNNLAMPVSPTKSYSIYTGAVDAMVQWWYGHNAVGFFLTAGFLGMMYYFIPKQAGPADLFLPAVDRALLGADRDLHVGGPAPPAVHRAAGLGAVARHGVLAGAAGAVLGRRDQRHHDAVRRVA